MPDLTWDVVAAEIDLPVTHLCRHLNLCRSTYYQWVRLKAPFRLTLDEHLWLRRHLRDDERLPAFQIRAEEYPTDADLLADPDPEDAA